MDDVWFKIEKYKIERIMSYRLFNSNFLKIFTVFFLLGCKNKSYFNESKDVEEVIEYVNPDKENRVEEFKSLVLEKGDQYSYARLFEIFADSENPYDLFPYSTIMVNKYKDYEYPCRDLFYLKIWKYDQNTKFLDHNIDQIVKVPNEEIIEIIDTLEKCGENGSNEAIALLIDYYSFIDDHENILKWKKWKKSLPKRQW